ncbi:hypothetical protein [Vibrio phage vB_VhaP_PG11]|nr:hypothetical protein [Vibrio phage vB_VhaP_PG11]
MTAKGITNCFYGKDTEVVARIRKAKHLKDLVRTPYSVIRAKEIQAHKDKVAKIV